MWGATLWGGVHGSLSRVMIWGTHFEEVEVSDEESWVGQAKNEAAKEEVLCGGVEWEGLALVWAGLALVWAGLAMIYRVVDEGRE